MSAGCVDTETDTGRHLAGDGQTMTSKERGGRGRLSGRDTKTTPKEDLYSKWVHAVTCNLQTRIPPIEGSLKYPTKRVPYWHSQNLIQCSTGQKIVSWSFGVEGTNSFRAVTNALNAQGWSFDSGQPNWHSRNLAQMSQHGAWGSGRGVKRPP